MKKSFIKELLHRRIPQIIGSYFIASTSMILFLDWLKINYNLPEEYITLALFGTLSILPSVVIIAYFHGAPGKDEWTKIEKIGIPINIIFIFSVLLIGYKGNWWFEDESRANKYFIHITSNERYIEDYYVDMAGMVKGWDKDRFVITSISDSLLEHIHKSIFSNVVSRFHNMDVEIETHINKEEFNLLNRFSSPRGYLNLLISNYEKGDSKKEAEAIVDSIASIYLSEESYIEFENKIKERLNFSPDYIMVLNVYNVHDKKLDKFHGMHYEFHLLVDWGGKYVGPYLPGTFHISGEITENSDKLIEELSDYIPREISELTFGNLVVGQVSEILNDNMVKILLYDNQSINRSTTLMHTTVYNWLVDGYEMRIEDLELALEYYLNNPDKYDSTKYQTLSSELKELKDGTGRNRGERSGYGRLKYILNIIEVVDNIVIAEIIFKSPPYMKVRVRDEIKLKFE